MPIITLTDSMWKKIMHLFPGQKPTGRPQIWSDFKILQAILTLLDHGAKWRIFDEISGFPPRSTVYDRLSKWVADSVFLHLRDFFLNAVFLSKEDQKMAAVFIDGTFVRAMQGGDKIGETKIGKGSKIMVIVDEQSSPIAAIAASANPHESQLVEMTLESSPILKKIKFLVGDKAYDSDPLDKKLKERFGIEMIAPHKDNRKKAATQGDEELFAYKDRWKCERFNSWLKIPRRLLVRHDKKIIIFQAFLDLFCSLVLIRRLFS